MELANVENNMRYALCSQSCGQPIWRRRFLNPTIEGMGIIGRGSHGFPREIVRTGFSDEQQPGILGQRISHEPRSLEMIELPGQEGFPCFTPQRHLERGEDERVLGHKALHAPERSGAEDKHADDPASRPKIETGPSEAGKTNDQCWSEIASRWCGQKPTNARDQHKDGCCIHPPPRLRTACGQPRHYRQGHKQAGRCDSNDPRVSSGCEPLRISDHVPGEAQDTQHPEAT